MAKQTFFKDPSSGSSIIDISEGGLIEIVINDMPADFGRHSFHILFIGADGETIATPSAGTVDFSASSDSMIPVYNDISNGTFNAADVYSVSRDIPQVGDIVVSSKLTLDNVAGATYARAYVWGF